MRWLPLLGVLAGCATVQTSGTFTNPAVPRARAEAPAIALRPVACEGPAIPTHAAASAEEKLAFQLSLSLSALQVEAAEESRPLLCHDLATDRLLFSDAVFGTVWKVPAATVSYVRALAQVHSARTVWVPIVRPRASCQRPETRDSYSRPQATLDFDGGCGVSDVDVALFLFDAGGTLQWKSSGTAGGSELATIDRVSAAVVAELPPQAPRDTAVVKDVP